MSVTLPNALVVVSLSQTTKAPLHVFDYELPILEAIFGPQEDGEWHVVEEGEQEVEEFDAATAYEGLKSRWGAYEGENYKLRAIYRDPNDFANKIGADAPSEERTRSRALIVDSTKTKKPAAAKKAAAPK